jgi:hypothetical protein
MVNGRSGAAKPNPLPKIWARNQGKRGQCPFRRQIVFCEGTTFQTGRDPVACLIVHVQKDFPL